MEFLVLLSFHIKPRMVLGFKDSILDCKCQIDYVKAFLKVNMVLWFRKFAYMML